MLGQRVDETDISVNGALGLAVEREILNELLAYGRRIGMYVIHSPESGTPSAPLRPKSSTPRSGFVQLFGGANGGGRCPFADSGMWGPPPSLTSALRSAVPFPPAKACSALARSCSSWPSISNPDGSRWL